MLRLTHSICHEKKKNEPSSSKKLACARKKWPLTQGSLRSHFSFEARHREHESVNLRTPVSEPTGAVLWVASTMITVVVVVG